MHLTYLGCFLCPNPVKMFPNLEQHVHTLKISNAGKVPRFSH